MLKEVAEFSLMTCPHLALPAAQYRRSGLEGKTMPQHASMEKSAILMCGMAKSYQLARAQDGIVYVKAGPWKALSWWREGRKLGKQEALDILAEVAPDLDITQGGRLKKS